MPCSSRVDFRPCAPNAPIATARKQSPAAIRNSKTDILLFPAVSTYLQLLFEIDQGCLSAVSNRFHIENRSSRSESRCSEKIQRWSEFPQIRAENCAGADYQIAHKIVRANYLAAS